MQLSNIQVYLGNKRLILLIFLALLFISTFFILSSSRNSPSLTPQSPETPSTSTLPENQSPENQKQSLYFAKTTASGVEISTYSEGKNTKITTLPPNIRSIIPLSQNRLLFVNNLSFLDRGGRIDLYDGTQNLNIPLVHPSPAYLIENFLISPDEESIVFWEVEERATTQGRSHIIYQSLSDKSQRKVLVDESLSDQTKYPVLWGPNKWLFLDSYSVNRRGLHQGFFALDLNSTTPNLVTLLSLDSYSSLPILSADSKKLIFSSYNPESTIQLSPPDVPNGLFRAAIRNPNQIKIYDLATRQTSILYESKNGELFTDLVFTGDNSNIIFKRSSISGNSVKALDIQKLNIPNISTSLFLNRIDSQILGQYEGRLIIAFGSAAVAPLGGINVSYSPIYKNVYLYDDINNQYEKILSDDPVQVIGIL
ncbi:hypothetical protein HY407_03655 [Candidatus Gottesmanbacteria bacterium]|nr:hypothetical protein [Candidatus Gottesmanbacteria bacterium]